MVTPRIDFHLDRDGKRITWGNSHVARLQLGTLLSTIPSPWWNL